VEENELIAIRKQKLQQLHERRIPAYGSRFDVSGTIEEVRSQFGEGKKLRAAGRITAHRNMGKSQFMDLSDVTGRIQIFVSLKEIPADQVSEFELLDIGDFLGVEGECFLTKTGEPTLRIESLKILSKTLRPLPDKWHGVSDVEIRYRQRYLDLIANNVSRQLFLQRSKAIQQIRNFLSNRGFIEVETPMMQSIAGGAAAQPFRTHHNALGIDLYLRIAPELYLKRLLVGGFPKIFELNRNFRNEGISRKHNPEFTMLEIYWAYADFELMADLVEELICSLAETIASTSTLSASANTGDHLNGADTSSDSTSRSINLKRPWKRARYHDLIQAIDPSWFQRNKEEKLVKSKELGVETHPGMEEFEITQQIFEKLIEAKTFDPLFVTHLPKELVPLAKQNAENPDLVDVYELIINGQEISPGYSELNDPRIQRDRLLAQLGEETQNLDEDFLLALEHGMPPAGGIGIGIDRLIMMLTGAESIRDVILFPQLKPKPEVRS
jgi:lysyl-tRNA synthetase, class II